MEFVRIRQFSPELRTKDIQKLFLDDGMYIEALSAVLVFRAGKHRLLMDSPLKWPVKIFRYIQRFLLSLLFIIYISLNNSPIAVKLIVCNRHKYNFCEKCYLLDAMVSIPLHNILNTEETYLIHAFYQPKRTPEYWQMIQTMYIHRLISLRLGLPTSLPGYIYRTLVVIKRSLACNCL